MKLDNEMIAEQDGRKLGHQEAMQEVLGKLRIDFDEAKDVYNLIKEDRKSYYQFKLYYIKGLVEHLFGEEEADKMKVIY